MQLLTYLRENFPGPFDDTFLKNHFKEKFGVDVKIENDLFLFKYDQIEANWNESVTECCRGTILRYQYNTWEICSRPWFKFHNIGDSKCYINESNFSTLRNKRLVEKLDGSCIQVWYDDSLNKWRASTLGSITTTNVFDNDFTFSELFFRYVPENFFDVLPHNHTYLFELCTVYNKVVTKYEKDVVYFLGVFENNSGKQTDLYDAVLDLYSQYVSENNIEVNLKLPKTFDADHFETIQQMIDFVEKESESDVYGINPEGFVLYLENHPVAKLKNEKYKYLHRIMTGDPLHVKKNLVGLFFMDKIDDCYSDLTDEMKQFVDRLSSKYKQLRKEIDVVYESIKHLKENRKEYALSVQSQNEDVKMFSGYFYEQLKTDSSFRDWLLKEKGSTKIFESYMDFFKSI